MTKTKNIFIISIIIHAILFILLTYIAMPPLSYQFNSGIIETEIFRIRPDVQDKPQKPEIMDKKQLQKEEIKKEAEEKLPVLEPLTLNLSLTEPSKSTARRTVEQKEVIIAEKPQINEIVSPRPLINVFRNINNTDVRPIVQPMLRQNERQLPSLNQDTGNLFNTSGSAKFRGLSVGPAMGSNFDRGISTKYVDAMTSINPKYGVSQFAEILSSLAEGIIKRSVSNKLDIVFIIDTTGSMQDNAEGVRNYIHNFLDPFKDKRIDVNLGLVLFSDQEVKKAKVIGTTDNVEKFKKWFDKINFYGGRDIPESGYEAIIAAIENIKFRNRSQRFFIFISDSVQHDSDYDGKSIYSIDQIISILNQKEISVDVIGLDYLPVKQLAWGTGGQWKSIPGGDIRTDLPEHLPSKIYSNPSTPSRPDILEDNVKVKLDSVMPSWVELSYKVLDPKGNKVFEASSYKKEVRGDHIDFPVKIDFGNLQSDSGIYTLIYKIKDSFGNQQFLRQALQITVEE